MLLEGMIGFTRNKGLFDSLWEGVVDEVLQLRGVS